MLGGRVHVAGERQAGRLKVVQNFGAGIGRVGIVAGHGTQDGSQDGEQQDGDHHAQAEEGDLAAPDPHPGSGEEGTRFGRCLGLRRRCRREWRAADAWFDGLYLGQRFCSFRDQELAPEFLYTKID